MHQYAINMLSICYPLKSKYASYMKPNIVVKLKSCKAKLKMCIYIGNTKKLKGRDVYIDEHLTSQS